MAETQFLFLQGPMSTPQLHLFQNHQTHINISSGHDVIHTEAPFAISFVHGRKTVPNDYAPELLTRIVKGPTKMKNKI